jgi:hypothetical protein
MTRELLERAALAMGLTLVWGEKFQVGDIEVDCSDQPYVKSDQPDVADTYWNPKDDDGDMARMETELRLDGPHWGDRHVWYFTPMPEWGSGGRKVHMERLTDHPDANAARRMAALRAAASLPPKKERA